jgi:ribosome recycling factor
MDTERIIGDARSKFKAALEHFQSEIKRIRTGRAQASMLDGLMVSAYGVEMPLNQVASITTPEAQLLQITPFDPGNLQAVVSSIRDNPTLGLNPSDDGRVVRVPIPPLSEERRREFVKLLGSKVEGCMIALRSIRRDAVDTIDQAKKDKDIGEDDAKRLSKRIDDALNTTKTDVELSAKAKETEIMTV